jgi:hypothetical protein
LTAVPSALPPFGVDPFKEISPMRVSLVLAFFLASSLAAQQLPAPSELSGEPWFVKQHWVIGGEGDWDGMAFDNAAQRLYIAHGAAVQIVDVETGRLESHIDGFLNARAIALDETGEKGFISDSKADALWVFDRRTGEKTVRIGNLGNPRRLVYDASTQFLFVFGEKARMEIPERDIPGKDANGKPTTRIERGRPLPYTAAALIDTHDMSVIARFRLPGEVVAVYGDGQGTVWVGSSENSPFEDESVYRIDAAESAKRLQKPLSSRPWNAAEEAERRLAGSRIFFSSSCKDLAGIAFDARRQRLFVACGSRLLTIWNPLDWQLAATVKLDSAPGAMIFDPDRNLIFLGGSDGAVTVVRQHVTDSYYAVQQLPVPTAVRAMALNPQNGAVYLVANPEGFDLSKPFGIGTVRSVPIPESFQVLVLAN